MAIGQNFYGDQGLSDIENLSRSQSAQSLAYGDQAARYADPFMKERPIYQNQLRKLTEKPGDFASSPVYQFAYDEGLNALQRKGNVRSGAKLAALMKYGQDRASQLYGMQANILSPLAMSGSSPASAGMSYAYGTARSQDQAQMAAAARMAGSGGRPALPQMSDSQRMMNELVAGRAGGAGSVGGGYSAPAYGGYTPSYIPSSAAGTGYVTSDYGTTTFGDSLPSGGYSTEPDYGYDPYSGYDFGYSDYGYSDYGGYDDWGGGYDYGGGWDDYGEW